MPRHRERRGRKREFERSFKRHASCQSGGQDADGDVTGTRGVDCIDLCDGKQAYMAANALLLPLAVWIQ